MRMEVWRGEQLHRPRLGRENVLDEENVFSGLRLKECVRICTMSRTVLSHNVAIYA